MDSNSACLQPKGISSAGASCQVVSIIYGLLVVSPPQTICRNTVGSNSGLTDFRAVFQKERYIYSFETCSY